MSMLDSLARIASPTKHKHRAGKAAGSSVVADAQYITLVVEHNHAAPQSVRQYPATDIEAAIRVGVQIISQNRASKCVIFSQAKVKLARIECCGLLGGKVRVLRYFGTAKTRQTLRGKELRAMQDEGYV